MVVTNVHTPCFKTVCTHLIDVDILDVNGAAMHASPNLYVLLMPNKSLVASFIDYWAACWAAKRVY